MTLIGLVHVFVVSEDSLMVAEVTEVTVAVVRLLLGVTIVVVSVELLVERIMEDGVEGISFSCDDEVDVIVL